MNNKNTKAVILTGACGLLGFSTMNALIDQDWHVIAIDKSEPLHSIPDGASFIQFDLTDIKGYKNLKDEIRKLTFNLKALINNAAYNPKVEDESNDFGRFEDLQLETWNEEIALNLTAPVFLARALLDTFNHTDNQPCKIVNVISTYGIVAPNHEIYASLAKEDKMYKPIGYPVTKAGLAMATKYLAVYLAPRGFNVNGIAPGGIENNQPKEFIEAYSRLTPMHRMAKVEEMMDVMLLLCSKGSDYMNGHIVSVDGGWTIW